jgi:hypothetical protein
MMLGAPGLLRHAVCIPLSELQHMLAQHMLLSNMSPCLMSTPRSAALQLPASLFAYRKQQHRWSAGPTQLIKLAMREVCASYCLL